MFGSEQYSEPVIHRLTNPMDAIWHGLPPRLEPWSRRENTQPLIFIHGMEYYSAQEVVADLVTPFEHEARMLQSGPEGQFDVLLLKWESRIFPGTAGRMIDCQNPWRSAGRLLGSVMSWPVHLHALEHRAMQAARQVAPLFRDIMDHSQGVGPVVVSHSMGARVWTEIIKSLSAGGHALVRPGTWWNLQPALPHNVFASGQEYGCVPHIYRQAHGHMHLWYSRFDLVLSTLFAAARKCLAMGLVGCGARNTPEIDVSHSAGEAHGHVFLRKDKGHFFRRVGPKIREQSTLHFRGT